VRCAREKCHERDVKGLYARARDGALAGVTGYDAAYEEPAAPDVVVDTDQASVEACVAKILEECFERLVET